MSLKKATDQEKVEWLANHPELWEDDLQYQADAVALRMFRYLQRAKYYAQGTSYEAVGRGKILGLLTSAKRKIDEEEMFF